MSDYDGACPECGYDGPHPVMERREDGSMTIECNDHACGVEFEVPAE